MSWLVALKRDGRLLGAILSDFFLGLAERVEGEEVRDRASRKKFRETLWEFDFNENVCGGSPEYASPFWD